MESSRPKMEPCKLIIESSRQILESCGLIMESYRLIMESYRSIRISCGLAIIHLDPLWLIPYNWIENRITPIPRLFLSNKRSIPQIFHVILTRKKYINMSHIILPKLFFLCFISTNSQSYNRHHQSLSTPPQLFNLSQWLLLSLFRQLFPILKITYLNLLSRIALLFDHYFSPISKHTAPSEANLKLWLTQAEETRSRYKWDSCLSTTSPTTLPQFTCIFRNLSKEVKWGRGGPHRWWRGAQICVWPNRMAWIRLQIQEGVLGLWIRHWVCQGLPRILVESPPYRNTHPDSSLLCLSAGHT